MTNQALPKVSRDVLDYYLKECQNLGLILDKFAPWRQDGRSWNLVAKVKPSNKSKDARVETGGQAKGHWLKANQRVYDDESPSVFINSNNQIIERVDVELMEAMQKRWLKMVENHEGIAFRMTLAERMAAGLGASHVLETGLTLDRNTGLPYLPGSTVKGLARAWGLIDVAGQLGIRLTEASRPEEPLNRLATILIEVEQAELDTAVAQLIDALPDTVGVSDQAGTYLDFFRFIFGSQVAAGAVCFTDAIYYGRDEPRYATDVMTPHFVQYYTEDGGSPPADDDDPNPVSFLTVDSGNTFAFGILPRAGAFENMPIERAEVLGVAQDWLIKGLTQLGAGSKTAAGYGFFSGRSKQDMIGTS